MKEWNATTMRMAKPRKLPSAKLDLDMLAHLGRDPLHAVDPDGEMACTDKSHCAAFSPSLQRAHAGNVSASPRSWHRCARPELYSLTSSNIDCCNSKERGKFPGVGELSRLPYPWHLYARIVPEEGRDEIERIGTFLQPRL
jgi:hypothetical protein